MAKKYDLKDLGEVYGNLGKEATVVAESTDKATVGDESAAVGEAPLEDGGITKDCGCEEPEEVEGTDAPGVENPGEPEATKEEDEETAEEVVELEEDSINNSMANKSIFDELYAKVLSEDFGMEEQDDLNALGIEDATPDAELGEEGDDDTTEETDGEEVTITLDKDTAKKLHDLLMAVLDGGEDHDDEDGDEEPADEVEGEDGEHYGAEEDNEGAPKAHTTHVDHGENNKVGHPDGLGGEGKGHADGGDSADQTKLGDNVDDGKNNKVGSTEEGFGDLKVEPMKKA